MDAIKNNTEITARMLEDNLKGNGNDANVSDYQEKKFLIQFNKTGHEYITDKSGKIIMNGTSDKQDEDNADLYIYNVETLSKFRDRVNAGENFEGKIIKVTKDIDFGAENTTNWEPIGNETNYFNGIFDGQGHKISNLYINATTMYQGLFGLIDKTGIVKNITVTGSIKSTKMNVAGIAGLNLGIIENCGNLANIESDDTDVGGIAGSNNGIIIKCYNSGNVKARSYSAGGITAWNGDGVFEQGILGEISYIFNCYNTGLVISKDEFRRNLWRNWLSF